MNYKKYIDVLHNKMETEKDISKVFEYFLDHLGANPTFMKMGKIVEEHPVADVYVRKCVDPDIAEKGPLYLLLNHIQYKDFYHGLGVIGGKSFTILLFGDTLLAVVALSVPNREKMNYFRMRGVIASFGKVFKGS